MQAKWYLIFILILVVSTSFVDRQDGITVTVTGLRNNKGHVLLSLFKGAEGYPGNPSKAFRKVQLTISANKASIDFPSLPSGDYAIAILHDENDDQKMKTNWLGLPAEGYGFSNNVMGVAGPPSFNKAHFNYTAGKAVTITIKTRY
ncbi:MAG TPA: DUF2141 domain-containing protein [Chitinophagaceae bacterium]